MAIASTAAAAMNHLDAPVIGDYLCRSFVQQTQKHQLAFQNCEPYSPDAGESKKRQNSV
jgi:hypothetical protein